MLLDRRLIAAGVTATSRVARRAGAAALDLLLPPQCATCEAPVQQAGQFCADCFCRIAFITAPCCRQCGVPLAVTAHADAGGLCRSCEEVPPHFDQARAALRYDAHARQVILPFKHADRTELARTLAPLMAHAGAGLLQRADLLVPVPLHRFRLFHRRYNQAALLVRVLSRLSRVPAVPDALRRDRATPSLGARSAAERAEMVHDAFSVRRCRMGRVAGRRVLLVDDVMTSGATANACTDALLAAGAAAVDVLVAARVPDPRLA